LATRGRSDGGYRRPVPTRLWSVVFDCTDPVLLGRWWSETLGWRVSHEADDEVTVDGPESGLPSLTFGTVPEGRAGKNRVHLDLASRSASHQAEIVERLLARGATPADIGQDGVPWVVLADPEGNELCVLEPRPEYGGAAGSLAAVVVDAHTPRQLAGFWAAASGWELSGDVDSEDAARLVRPGGAPPFLELVATPDAKVGKNRVHLDVAPFAADDRDREVARLVSLGARPVDVGQCTEVTWVVLADPEGNEFCVLRSR
jgi:hypothetical protein